MWRGLELASLGCGCPHSIACALKQHCLRAAAAWRAQGKRVPTTEETVPSSVRRCKALAMPPRRGGRPSGTKHFLEGLSAARAKTNKCRPAPQGSRAASHTKDKRAIPGWPPGQWMTAGRWQTTAARRCPASPARSAAGGSGAPPPDALSSTHCPPGQSRPGWNGPPTRG